MDLKIAILGLALLTFAAPLAAQDANPCAPAVAPNDECLDFPPGEATNFVPLLSPALAGGLLAPLVLGGGGGDTATTATSTN